MLKPLFGDATLYYDILMAFLVPILNKLMAIASSRPMKEPNFKNYILTLEGCHKH